MDNVKPMTRYSALYCMCMSRLMDGTLLYITYSYN